MTYHNRLEITKAVLKEIPVNLTEDHKLPIEQVMFKWWQGRRTGSGLRLTDEGFDAFTKAEIAYYEFPVFSSKTDIKGILNNPSSFILSLSKKIKCPFYIMKLRKDVKSEPTIRIYDDKIAMLITLYGTLQEYLDSSAYK